MRSLGHFLSFSDPIMRLTRLHLFLLTLTLLAMPLTAQQLVQTRVEVDVSALSATGAKEVEGLRERIRKFGDGFSPDVRLSMTPKEPMQVSLYILSLIHI